MPKKSSLRDRCLAEAPEIVRSGSLNWLQKLPTGIQGELLEIIREWSTGGDIRNAYPSSRALARWISSLGEVQASASTIRNTISEIAKSTNA